MVFKIIISYMKNRRLRKSWRKLNKHNQTELGRIGDISKIIVGSYTYGTINAHFYDNPNERLEIGSFCSIAGNVQFICGGEHNYNTLLTYPVKLKFFDKPYEAILKGSIIIKDDVWIGENTTILSGVTVGQGAVIGAGSIVTKDVPPYAITDGRRIIKYRFNNSIIEKLLKINFSKIDSNFIKSNRYLFIEDLTEEKLSIFLK